MRLETAMTEAQWQQLVIEYAQVFGWKVAHFRPAQTEKGWRTPVQADGRGFFDLVLIRDRVIFAELKSQKGIVSPDQWQWFEAARDAKVEVYVWRPRDWPEVQKLLARKP